MAKKKTVAVIETADSLVSLTESEMYNMEMEAGESDDAPYSYDDIESDSETLNELGEDFIDFTPTVINEDNLPAVPKTKKEKKAPKSITTFEVPHCKFCEAHFEVTRPAFLKTNQVKATCTSCGKTSFYDKGILAFEKVAATA